MVETRQRTREREEERGTEREESQSFDARWLGVGRHEGAESAEQSERKSARGVKTNEHGDTYRTSHIHLA